MNYRSFVIALLLAAGSPVFANEPLPAADPPRGDAPQARDIADRNCLRETGTHLRPRADRAGSRTATRDRCALQFGRTYTREDLNRTGQTDIAQALRMLDPSIY